MKTLATMMLAVLAALPFCSCQRKCDCNLYNKDYLRDVKPSSSQRFE